MDHPDFTGFAGELFTSTTQTGDIDPAPGGSPEATAEFLEHASHVLYGRLFAAGTEEQLLAFPEIVIDGKELVVHVHADKVADTVVAPVATGNAETRKDIASLVLQFVEGFDTKLPHHDFQGRVIVEAVGNILL